MNSEKKDSRTAFVNIGICKIEDGNVCIYGIGDRPEASFGVLMTPKVAQAFTRLVSAVVDERVPAGCSTYIRAELLGCAKVNGGRRNLLFEIPEV